MARKKKKVKYDWVAHVSWGVQLTEYECRKLAALCLAQATAHANAPDAEPGRQEPWLALAEKLNRAAL